MIVYEFGGGRGGAEGAYLDMPKMPKYVSTLHIPPTLPNMSKK